MTLRNVRALLTVLLLATSLVAGGCIVLPSTDGYTVFFLAPEAGESAEDFELRVRRVFSLAQPGSVFEFGEGTFVFTRGLILTASHVVVRGQGIDVTILDFAAASGGQAILFQGDASAIHDLTIFDSPGDGVKAENATHVTVQNTKVIWPNFVDRDNGAYGIYTVGCDDVLVEFTHVIAASDAGIYVGQSDNAIVRNNFVEHNVMGIEIENVVGGEVYYNLVSNNTGGILSYDLPGLPPRGRVVAIYDNILINNNTENFGNGFVALVPPGTGVIITANDDIEVYRNRIINHATAGIVVINYELTLEPTPENYEPTPERISVHDNVLDQIGYNPTGIGETIQLLAGGEIPDIFYDNIPDPDLQGPDGFLLPEHKICVFGNGRPTGSTSTNPEFGILSVPVGEDRYSTAPFEDCPHDPIPSVVRNDLPDLPPGEEMLSPEETAALCNAPGDGVNWDAFPANCPNFSQYRLFTDGDPRTGPSEPDRAMLYDLTTPLFSDYANKYRYVFVPPGEQINFDPHNPFDMPVGTIISKTFAFDDPIAAEEIVVETRLYIHREAGWKGLPYIWNEDFTEAFYEPAGGMREVTINHPTDGPTAIPYEIPDVNQCSGCHGRISGGDFIIGPKARLLNREVVGGGTNQLVELENKGLLAGLPGDLGTVEYLPVWDDPADGTLEERARAYLESNCAHCHSTDGRASFSGLFLDIDTDPASIQYGICKPPVAAGSGSGGFSFDIVPGSPETSILSFRMEAIGEATKMPELAKVVAHIEGVQLVNDWIATLPGNCE